MPGAGGLRELLGQLPFHRSALPAIVPLMVYGMVPGCVWGVKRSGFMQRLQWVRAGGVVCCAALALISAGASGCKMELRGSGTQGTVVRKVDAISGVEVGGNVWLEVSQGPEQRVELTADDNILPLILTEVRGEVLYLDTKRPISPKSRVELRVTLNQGIKRLACSGASEAIVREIESRDITVEVSGAARVTLAGHAQRLSASLSGSSYLDARELEVITATADASGSASATLNALTKLEARASGTARVRYMGRPKLEQSTSGKGTVQRWSE